MGIKRLAKMTGRIATNRVMPENNIIGNRTSTRRRAISRVLHLTLCILLICWGSGDMKALFLVITYFGTSVAPVSVLMILPSCKTWTAITASVVPSGKSMTECSTRISSFS